MSRLIEEFSRATQAAAQPMGFRTARPAASVTRILLIASLEIGATDNPADYTDGASALLLRPAKSRLTAETIQTMVESLPEIPWGIYLDDNVDKQAAALIEAGCDFVIIPAAGRIATTPREEKVGRILQVESSMDDGLLRAVNDLPVDAVLVTDTFEGSGSLVWHQLMIFQHLARLISKPLIVPIPADVGEEELKALWEAGVDGAVVEVDSSSTGVLKELRQAIDKLPPRSPRKRDKMEALLPRAGGESKAITPDEEEEEEEYE
ncbi:MAG: hypothetical protein KAW90_06030 [Dehalococcoidales bacterium]|nr:hypothetical protein [Dehalococcoidales bacterium]